MADFKKTEYENMQFREAVLDGFYVLVKVPHMAIKQVFDTLTWIRNIKELMVGESVKYDEYYHVYLKFHENLIDLEVRCLLMEYLRVEELQIVPCTSNKINVIKHDSDRVMERDVKFNELDWVLVNYVVTIDCGVAGNWKKSTFGTSLGLYRRLQRDRRVKILHVRECPVTHYIKLHLGFNENLTYRDVKQYFEELIAEKVYFVEPILMFPRDLKFVGNVFALNVYERQKEDVELYPPVRDFSQGGDLELESMGG